MKHGVKKAGNQSVRVLFHFSDYGYCAAPSIDDFKTRPFCCKIDFRLLGKLLFQTEPETDSFF